MVVFEKSCLVIHPLRHRVIGMLERPGLHSHVERGNDPFIAFCCLVAGAKKSVFIRVHPWLLSLPSSHLRLSAFICG